MKIAEAVISTAADHGLRHFFGIPGGGAPLDLIEAGRKSGVQFVNVSHESSAAIAAAYYGQAKNSPGLALGIRGVGAANMVGGVANVYFERMPLVAVCECAAGQGHSVQQCDQEKLFAGVAGYQAVLESQGGARKIREAFSTALDGRPSASILHWPSGVSELEEDDQSPSKLSSALPSISESDLLPAKEFLAKSRRLVILAGADVLRAGATQELLQFAEANEAAVLVTMDARGVFRESHPRWAGVFLGMFNPNVIEGRVLQQADAVLLVGVDAMMTHAPWKLSVPTCELVARPEYPTMSSPVVRINGDLKALLPRLSASPQSGFSEDEIRGLRAGILEYFKRPPRARFAAQDIIEIMRELLPPDGLLISETGIFICMLEHLWPVDRPGTYLGTSGGRTMGLTIPAVLGARLADPKRPMMGLGGDGSLLMRLGELETIARTGIAVPIVIIDDHALGTMKSRQRSRGFPDFGLDLHPVNFTAIAKACGLHGVTVKTPEAFREALRQAVSADRTTLIDARVDPKPYQNSFGRTIGVLDQPTAAHK